MHINTTITKACLSHAGQAWRRVSEKPTGGKRRCYAYLSNILSSY